MAAVRVVFAAALSICTTARTFTRTSLRGIDFNDGMDDSTVAGLNDVNPANEAIIGDEDGGEVADEQWQPPPPTDEANVVQPAMRASLVKVGRSLDAPLPASHFVVIPADLSTSSSVSAMTDSDPSLVVANTSPANNTAFGDVSAPRAGEQEVINQSLLREMLGAAEESSVGDHVTVRPTREFMQGAGDEPSIGDHDIAVAQLTTAETRRTGAVSAVSAVKRRPRVLREFDDQAAEHDVPYEALNHDAGAVRDGEVVSMEDQQRLAAGDVVHVTPPPRHPRHRHVSPGAPRMRHALRKVPPVKHLALGSRLHRNMYAFQQGMLAARTSQNAHERMSAQCNAWASFMSGQELKGSKFIRAMKDTCTGAIKEGIADMAYTVMCSALGAAVEPLATGGVMRGGAWDPADVCKAMLKVFNEAGIGK